MKPVILILTITICSMQLAAQARLHISGGTTITSGDGANVILDDVDLENDGAIKQEAGDGSFTFTGYTQSLFSGRGSTQLNKLVLSKSASASLLLNTNINISGQLQFLGGRLNLGNNNINLGSSGVLESESETSNVFSTANGYIEAISSGNANKIFNAGNLGAVISSTSDLGTTIIRRGHLPQANSITGSESILRYYDIIPSNNNNLNATVQLRYFDAESNKIDEAEFSVLKSSGAGWKALGADARNSTGNYVEKKGINTFSRLTLFSAGPVLKESFAFWPNPVLNTMNLSAHSMTSGNMNIKVYNSDGALVQVQHESVASGVNQLKLDLHKLPQGNYTIETNWDGKVKISKFSKM